jgi:spore maturation protein CgeB
MKILVIGPDSEYTQQILKALKPLVDGVTYVDERGIRGLSVPLWRFLGRVSVFRRLRKQATTWHVQKAVEHTQPTHALVLKGTSLMPELLVWMRARGIQLANWFPENGASDSYAGWLTRTIGLYDHFFSFDSALAQRQGEFPSTRILTLPFAVDPQVFAGLDTDPDMECDVCFVGAPYPDRVALLESVQDLNVRIYGWDGWRHTSLARFWYGPLDARMSARAYRSAKICVNTNIVPHAHGANVKTFEICASGGFQLTDEVCDLKDSFLLGQELDVFHSPAEFREKVLCWLAHPEERMRIAQAGQARVARDHTMQARMKQMLERLA